MLDFTAIDFETANSFQGSPCAVGVVKVRGGHVIAQHNVLIRPPAAVGHFSAFNTNIHGISEADVQDAPAWADVLAWLVDFIGEDIVVAHNAGFDIGVIRYACIAEGTEWPELRFLCTLLISRRALSLASYTLPYVAESCGVQLENHHNALADAQTVVQIVAELVRRAEVNTLEELAAAHHIRVGTMAAGQYHGSAAIRPSGQDRLVAADANPDADPEGYLYGRVVVFTGKLMSMTRQMAWDEVTRNGGAPAQAPTKRTNVLVIGDFNPASLRPGAHFSGKARRAFELQDAGQDIELMTEYDFLRVLDGGDLANQGLAEVLASSQASPASEAARTDPAPPRVSRPLTREPSRTSQKCSDPDCTSTAAFRTNSRPTWCLDHISGMFHHGGLEAIEEFTHPKSYMLTRCLSCGVEAHYRFEYVLQKRGEDELVCRACYWRDWAAHVRDAGKEWRHDAPVDVNEVRQVAEANGLEYLQPLTAPSLPEDPHLTRCRSCGKVSAERRGDMAFGCTCSR